MPGARLLVPPARQADPRRRAAARSTPKTPTPRPSRLQKAYLPILRWTLRHSWVTLALAVLVLVGTIALAPLMKTNFLGDSGQNTFTVTQEVGPAAEPRGRGRRGRAGRGGAASTSTASRPCRSRSGRAARALRDAFTGGGGGITYSITTDPDADQVQLREDVQEAVADLDDVGR